MLYSIFFLIYAGFDNHSGFRRKRLHLVSLITIHFLPNSCYSFQCILKHSVNPANGFLRQVLTIFLNVFLHLKINDCLAVQSVHSFFGTDCRTVATSLDIQNFRKISHFIQMKQILRSVQFVLCQNAFIESVPNAFPAYNLKKHGIDVCMFFHKSAEHFLSASHSVVATSVDVVLLSVEYAFIAVAVYNVSIEEGHL